MEISEKITTIRKALKMSQAEFSKPLGVGDKQISAIEKGRVQPSPSVMELLFAKYLVNRVWWESGTPPMFTTTPTAEPLPPASPIIAVINSELERMDEDQHRQVLRVCLDINGEQYALAKHNSHKNRENRIKGGGG